MRLRKKELKMFIVLIALVGALGVSGHASDIPSIVFDFEGEMSKDGIPTPWNLKEKSGTAKVKIVPENGAKIAHFISEDSSFSLQRDISLSIQDYPYLTWEWKAVTLPPQGDVRDKDRNDQALQVLVAFEGRYILSYVWDSNAPVGTVTDESIGFPIYLDIKVLTVKTGNADRDKWVVMQRNIYDDYKRFFGEEPKPVKGLRVQTNSQYTESRAEGYFGKIVFMKKPDVSSITLKKKSETESMQN